MRVLFWVCASALTLLAACSSSAVKPAPTTKNTPSDGTLDAGPYTIVVRDFVYEPSNLKVPPGTAIHVINLDLEAHSVTSEAKLGDFVSGAVQGIEFDTGFIDTNNSASFSVPTSAVPGTVIPYFCTVHKSSMGEGRVTIE